jgi:hypothetical protein
VDPYLQLIDETRKRVVELEKRVKQLERVTAPTIPIYDNNNWPLYGVEGQIVIAPVGGPVTSAGEVIPSGPSGPSDPTHPSATDSTTTGGTTTGGTLPTGPSGLAYPTTDPPGWTRIFGEDFQTNVALGAWPASGSGGNLSRPPGYTNLGAYPYPWINSAGGGHYDPSKVLSIHDSFLDTYLHPDSGNGMIGTVQPLIPSGQTRLLIRFASLVQAVPGYHLSHLLWPDSNTWPRDGEIDFPECDMTSSATGYSFVHHQNGTSGGDQDYWNSGAVICDGRWHTYSIEWQAGNHVTVQRDDTAAHTFSNRIPSTPMHFEHQTDHNSSGSLSTSGHILTDWIVIWH